MKKLLILFVCSICLSACSSQSSNTTSPTPTPSQLVAKGSRVIGMDTNDASSDYSFVQSYQAAQSIGVTTGTLHIAWNSDEAAGSGATSGTFTDHFGALASANAYYPATTPASQVSLTIAPIDTPGPALPSDLSGVAMDNANVITRFNHFMDWALSQIPTAQITSIQIGNEIDAPSGASTALYWTQYKTFLTAVIAHLHTVKPGVKIGVTVTLYGLIGQSAAGATAATGISNLLSVVDEIGLTYYPLDSNFMMKDPSVVATDFAAVFTTLPSTTTVFIQEIGYSTSSSCGGSTANQVSFIDQIFSAWDLHASRIPFLAFLRMNDLSNANATSIATSFGLGGNAAFVAYLQTLGFRTYSGPSSFKSGWTELQNQTHLRGWW